MSEFEVTADRESRDDHIDRVAADVTNPAAPVSTRPRDLSAISAWWRVNWLTAAALTFIVVFAFSMRLENINWDKGQHLHPDERFQSIVMDSISPPSSVSQYFNTQTSPLNPYQNQGSYVYGTFPLFLNKAAAEWLDKDADGTTHRSAAPARWALENVMGVPLTQDGRFTFDGDYNSQLIGRVLSAMFDVFTILLLFEIGRVLFSRRVGLLAAGLLSLSVLNIQYSHFFGAETFLTFFVTAAIYFSVRIWKYGGWPNYLFAGLALGLALACKLSAVPVLLIPALAIAMRMWPQIENVFETGTPWRLPWRAPRADGALPIRVDWPRLVLPALGGLGLLAAAGVIFRLAQPYAFDTTTLLGVVHVNLNLRDDVLSIHALTHLEFLKPTHYFAFSEKYRKDIDNLLNQQSGTDFPPNLQWVNRTPFVFPGMNILLWGLGVPLALATIGGVIYGAWRVIRDRDANPLLPALWIVVLFLFVGRGFNPTMRYFLPMYPMMALMAAFGIVALWDFAASARARTFLPDRLAMLRPQTPTLLRGIAVAAVVGTLLWALAFLNIYREDISRVQASYWIEENIPHGSTLTSNEWDDGLPLNVPGVSAGNYEYSQLKPFAQDNDQKVQELIAGLDATDYVVETSNRSYATVPRIPARYPNTTLYYKTLFDGSLGFEKVAEFTNYPGIFGIHIPDQGSEEAFTVYDHPKVTIWKKTDAYSHARAVKLLQVEKAAAAVQVPPKDAAQNALYFRPDVLETQREGGTWSNIFNPGNFINAHPLFFWLLAMEIAAFALVPLAVITFRSLPDRGFLLTKPLGILALAYVAYAPASYGLVKYTRVEIALALGFLVAVGLVTAYHWRQELTAWARERWRFLAFCEALFLLIFVGAYWVRLQNPDLWHAGQGGEKPMDFAYLLAVIRSTDLSQGPIDPWHSGGYLNYYWFGQFIAATMTKLTGIVPEVAYNLIVPMFFALAAAATFSVAYNLAEATRRLMRRRPGGLPISPSGPLLVGIGAIFLVLLSGNLKAVQVLEVNLSKISPWHSGIPLLGGIIAIIGGFKEVIFGDATLRQVAYSYDWWDPSRALDVTDQRQVTPITEFPFWTFLFADLHAHLMAIPFSITSIGVGLGAVLNFTRLNPTRNSGDEHAQRTMQISSWTVVVVLGLIVGALRWINSWDYPPFLLLGAAAILIGERAKAGLVTWRMLLVAAVKSFVMAVLSYAFFAPFAHNYNMFYTGVIDSDQTTALSDYFGHFGVMLVLMTGFALFALQRSISHDRLLRRALVGRKSDKRSTMDFLPLMLAIVAGAAALMYVTSADRGGVIALGAVGLVAIIIVSFREFRSPSPAAPILLFVYAMIALGLGLSAGVEIKTLKGDIGRMNTVFKFYLHVWILWGIVAAYAVWYIFGVMKPQESFLRRAGDLNIAAVRMPRYAFAVVATLFIALALVYPYFGTRARIHNRFNPAQGTGNNGMDYMETAVYTDGPNDEGRGGEHVLKYDRDGIDWLRANVKGTPPIIEATTQNYHFGSRISIYTGLPAVAGWDFHQQQQRARFGFTVTKRLQDVALFYSTPDLQQARDIINRYDVQYVIVGDVERNYYTRGGGLQKFENGLGGSLEKVYENPGMQIWHVIPESELPDAANVSINN